MTSVADYKGPLAGLNVIDFGHYYAGPMAGMLLADQGASVIRVVRPAKPELREQQYRLLNRNKKLLTLDLKTPEGKAQALSMIEKADVVIENFRPGVMKRLGLDYTTVKKVNPSLIYLSLPGFASTDKERAHIQAWEGVLGAATGLFTETSLFRQILGFPPHYTWVPQCSMYGGINGAIAVTAALIAREEQGLGTVIEVPLADIGMLGCMIYIFMKRPSFALRATAALNAELPLALKPLLYSPEDSREVLEEKTEKARQAMYFAVTNRTYRCGDGRDIYINAFETAHINGRIVKALGVEKQLMREGFVNVGPWLMGLDNNICSSAELSTERKDRFVQLMSEVFLTKSAAEWEGILTGAGAMAAVVRSREEWLALEPMLESGVLAKLNENGPELITAGRIADISGPGDLLLGTYKEGQFITCDEADKLLSHRLPIKQPAENSIPLQKSDLLKGLKVLDLSNVAGGPMSGYLLTEYGADVIKADPPYYLFPGLIAGSIPILAGKRSILTDTTTAQGREILERLIGWADVVQHNILDDTAQRLGVSHQQLRQINPDIVSCQFSAFGGTRRGGWEKRPGFDHTLHAATGIMAQYGSLDRPHPHGMVAAGDMFGGFCLAFTAVLGAYQQRRSGLGGEGRTSLARALNYVQLPYMVAENGHSDWGEAKGQFSLGENWWQRLYECNDGWIYVGTSELSSKNLAEVVTGQVASDGLALEKAFALQNCAYWLKKLDAANIACHRVLSADEICKDAKIRSVGNEAAEETADGPSEILRWDDHPCGYPIVNLAPRYVRVGENQSYLRVRVAERVGKHTREILRELGYSENEIAELIRIRISHEFLPALGSKDEYLFEPWKNKPEKKEW